MTVLVTGSTGFVGREVVAELISRGIPTRALARSRRRARILDAMGAEIAIGDVADPRAVNESMRGVKSVLHLAAVIRENGDQTFFSVNHEGTVNVLDAAQKAGVERFVYASAIGSAPDGPNTYMASRWNAEQAVKRAGIPYTIMRFSMAFGRGDEFFNVLAALVKISPVVPVAGPGTTKFQPIAVKDVARCLVDALYKSDLLGASLELGGPQQLSYDGMLDEVTKALGARRKKLHLPLFLVRPMVWLMERALPRPPVTLEQLKMLAIDSVTDPDGVKKQLGFEPSSLRGNLDYLKQIGFKEALLIYMGLMPKEIRDH